MGYIRDIVATELASSNPSFKLDDRRLAELVSALNTPTHPAYALMIRRAIKETNEGGGLCEKAISEFIAKEYENLPLAHEAILKHHLRKLCEKREVLCTENERYILVSESSAGKVAVRTQQKKRKKGRRKGRPSRGKDRDGGETDSGDVGEGNQSRECEIEGIRERRNVEEEREGVAGELDKGKEENFEVVEERSEAEREETAVAEAQMESKSMKLDNGVSNEAILQQFNKAEHEASQNLTNKESVEEKQIVIISEPNEPQHQQTEVIEEQLQLEEVQNQWQQDTAELNKRIPTATAPSADPSSEGPLFKSAKAKILSSPHQQHHNQCELQCRKLRSYTKHNSGSASICESPLLSQQAERRGEERQCRQRDSKRKRDMEKNSEAELPLVIHQHQNEPSLKRCRAQGSPAKPASDVEQKLQGEKELSLLQQELENQTSHRLSRRILRSHYKESSVSDSATPTLTLSLVPSKPQNKQQQQVVAQQKLQMGNQTPHQLQRRILRSHHKLFPSISDSASPTLALSYAPSKPQNKQQQQSQPQVLGKRRGRPPKPKPYVDLNAEAELSLALRSNENNQQPPKRRGRGRPPKPKPDVNLKPEAALPLALRSNEDEEQPPKRRGRGRPPKTESNAGPALLLTLQHREEDKEALPKHKGRERPPKPKPKPNAGTAIALFETSEGRGGSPKAKETEVVTMASFSNRNFRKKLMIEQPKKGQGGRLKAK